MTSTGSTPVRANCWTCIIERVPALPVLLLTMFRPEFSRRGSGSRM